MFDFMIKSSKNHNCKKKIKSTITRFDYASTSIIHFHLGRELGFFLEELSFDLTRNEILHRFKIVDHFYKFRYIIYKIVSKCIIKII